MLEIIIIVLVIALINVSYLFYVYYNKVKELRQYFNILYSHSIFIYQKMQQIDKDKMFENDDYTGVIFNKLKELIYTFKDIYGDNDGKKA